jgi:hypothetical protein
LAAGFLTGSSSELESSSSDSAFFAGAAFAGAALAAFFGFTSSSLLSSLSLSSTLRFLGASTTFLS